MRIADVADDLRQAFDTASGGTLRRLVTYCQAHGDDPHMMIQTPLDGLPDGTMKLLVQAFDVQDQTVLFFDCQLEGSAQILGWNLVLYETTTAARSFLASATKLIDQVGPLEPAEGPSKAPMAQRTPEAMLELLQALKRSLAGA